MTSLRPRPLRKPHEQVALELNQNGLGDFPMDFASEEKRFSPFSISLDEEEPMDIDIKPVTDDVQIVQGIFF